MDWKDSYLGRDRDHFDRLKEDSQGGYGMGSSLERGVALGVVEELVVGRQNVEGWNLWRSRVQSLILLYSRPFVDLG